MQRKEKETKIATQAMRELLIALREAREDLVFRSLNEDPQLFTSLFQYENDENLLLLSFEREFFIFINSNLEKLCKHISDVENVDTKIRLRKIIEELLSFKKARNPSYINTVFLSERIDLIEKILSAFDKGRNRLEEINYIHKKDKVLFEREFKRLLGKQNGLA